MVQDLFLNATILITFITIGNQLFKDRGFSPSSSLRLKITGGIVMGILGCILMLYSVEIASKVIVDFRNIAIILAAIFGGFVSSIAAGIIIGAFRILHFGVTTSSIIGFIIALVIGIGCPIISLKEISLKKKWGYLTLFCNIMGSIAYTILINNTTLLIHLLSAYWIGSFMVAVVLYFYTTNLAVSNELFRKYKEESSKDFLTSLNNVRQFDKAFNEITNRLLEKEELLSLLFIDIDFFKKVNDTHGHAEGDMVLKELGKILLNTCRNFDIVSRNGGEEFSIMLMDCPPQQALNIAERIRSAVEKHPFTLSNGKTINITISIGVANYPETTQDFNQLIKKADTALYSAKQTGRNRVVPAEN
jgi:diguanylate cyclase